ncbi:MAG: 50S ribosomal protein L11 methyltransferase, partial [Blastocatellia bacterium]|nr:50S ribosomal protein L11 methyltransferase [Blastocatellia bacterium]
MSDIKAAIESLYKAYNVNPEEFTPERLAQSANQWKQNVLLNDLNLDCLHLSFDRKAFLAGSQFVIACSWQRDEVEQNPEFHNRKIVIIDPSISFGREHQTTLLMIELIEKNWQGRQLLDIGTGSGILAIVAQKLLPESRVEAFDISSDIVEYAHLMLELNGLEKSLELKQATVTDYPTETYDLV